MKNYYNILGISSSESISNIKKAYRSLALQYHPDKNKNSNAAFKFIEITEAYEVLRNPLKKEQYDIIYKKYFGNKKIIVQEPEYKYEDKKNQWKQYGKSKAEEYSAVNFEDFLKRAVLEIKIGSGYLPSLITILFFIFSIIVFSLVTIQDTNNNNGNMVLVVLITIIIIAIVGYHIYKVMVADYKEERKQKIHK